MPNIFHLKKIACKIVTSAMLLEKRRKILIICSALVISSLFVIMALIKITFIKYRLCPTMGDVLFPKEGHCYPPYRQGPCPPSMILMPLLSNRSVGVCHCDNLSSERTLVYDNVTEKCYFVFTQGPCQPLNWITLSPQGAICSPNICLNHLRTPSFDLVPLSDGSCALLGQPHPSCSSNTTVIKFFRRKLYPACEYSSPRGKMGRAIFAGFGVPQTDCPEGFYKTELGHCAVEFDDS